MAISLCQIRTESIITKRQNKDSLKETTDGKNKIGGGGGGKGRGGGGRGGVDRGRTNRKTDKRKK